MKRVLILVIVGLILMESNVYADTSIFLFNGEKSNFHEGTGNITYPVISHESEENFLFSSSIAVGDVNGDGHKEIVAISLQEGALYVYNQNLSVLWKYYDKYYLNNKKYSHLESMEGVGTSSLTLVDLDGDGIKDILFSISPSLSVFNTSDGIYYPKTVLHAFKGDGTEIWNITLNGGITADSVIVSDINSDSNPELIVGSDRIYVISFEGIIIHSYEIDNSSFTGVYEIMGHRNIIIFSFWEYDEPQEHGNVFSKPFNAHFSIRKIEFNNGTFLVRWNKELENSNDFQETEFYRSFSDENFSSFYLTQRLPSGILKINSSSGETEWKKESNSIVPPGLMVSVLPNMIIWDEATRIRIMDKDGRTLSSFVIYDNSSGYNAVWSTISVFDVNSDGKNEIILMDREGMYAFSMDGEKIWGSKLWPRAYGYWNPPPQILHEDVDNDSLDEIVTINPNGRIVIIDNGTPPSENQNSMFSQELIIGGTVIFISSIAISLMWIWRERKV